MVTKLWQTAFQLYFSAAASLAEPNVSVLRITVSTILDSDGIPVKIQYLMNRHLCC